MSVLIKNVLLHDSKTDILIEGSHIKKIAKHIVANAETVIDGSNKAVIPSFVNAHTHAAMTIMRGYADDMKVNEWLETKIWPLERKLTEEEVYWGAKFACLEMIKSGTTFFNDMYWHYHGTARAVEEMGIRAAISAVFIDLFDRKKAEEQIRLNEKLFDESKRYPSRIMFALGPHAIYTVSPESLKWCKQFSEKHDVFIHLHLSESEHEVEDCIKKHRMRPVEYLNSLGLLGPRLVLAHAIWLDEKEIELLQRFKVKVSYNPTSNMKLASGIFPYAKMNRKVAIALGTDGCASNNNLDMFEEMKVASLLQKVHQHDPTALPADDVFALATSSGAHAFNLNIGEIKEGMLADVLLLDMKNIYLNPHHHLVSNIVYSATSECVDTTICDGKILMQGRKVPGEEGIIRKANEIALRLSKR